MFLKLCAACLVLVLPVAGFVSNVPKYSQMRSIVRRIPHVSAEGDIEQQADDRGSRMGVRRIRRVLAEVGIEQPATNQGSWKSVVVAADGLHETVTREIDPNLGKDDSVDLPFNLKKNSLKIGVQEWMPQYRPDIISQARHIGFVWAAVGKAYCQDFTRSFRTAAAQLALDEAHGRIGNLSLPLIAYLVADDECQSFLEADTEFFPGLSKFIILNITTVKKVEEVNNNVNLYKPGSSVRLFVPEVLPLERFFYVDSDMMITGSLAPMVAVMEEAHEKTIFLSEEVDSTPTNPYHCVDCGIYTNPGIGIYDGKSIKAGPNGINAGLLGVNVRNWRAKNISQRVVRILEKYPLKVLRFGDQDILNILGRDDRALLEWMPCQFNWRPNSHCSETPTVLHGNMGFFYRNVNWKAQGSKLLAAADHVVKSTKAARRNLPENLWEIAVPEKGDDLRHLLSSMRVR